MSKIRSKSRKDNATRAFSGSHLSCAFKAGPRTVSTAINFRGAGYAFRKCLPSRVDYSTALCQLIKLSVNI